MVTESDAPLLRWTASVVRQRRDVLDRLDVQAGRMNGSDGAVATRARAFHTNLNFFYAILAGSAGSRLGSTLCREWGALPAALEADRTGTRPAEGVAVGIRDRHERVVAGIGRNSPHCF